MEDDEAIASASPGEKPDETLSLLHILSAMQKSMSETNILMTDLRKEKSTPASLHTSNCNDISSCDSEEAFSHQLQRKHNNPLQMKQSPIPRMKAQNTPKRVVLR